MVKLDDSNLYNSWHLTLRKKMQKRKFLIIGVVCLLYILGSVETLHAQDIRPVPSYGNYMSSCVKDAQPQGGFGSAIEKAVEEANCQCRFEHLPKERMTKDQFFSAAYTCRKERGGDTTRFLEKYYTRINREPQAAQGALPRTSEVSGPKHDAVAQPTPLIALEDASSLAAKLIANKKEYAIARASLSVGGAIVLTPTLQGMIGTDSFGEQPWCIVSLAGAGPEAAKGVAKWRLVYRREKAKGDDVVFTSSWEGASAPPRVSFDEETSYISAPDAMLFLGNAEFARRLVTSKSVTFKLTSSIAFTYDAKQIRLAQAIARKACP